VRYLRMLSNSVVAAMLGSGYVLTLVLQLNPTLPLHPVRLVPIVTTVGLFYTVHLTVIFYIILVMRQLFAREEFSPGWVSVGVLTWLGAAAALAGAALMWANLQTFALVLEPDTVIHVVNGALTLVVAAAFFVFVGVLRAHLGLAGRPVWALLFVAVATASIAAPLAVRGRGTPALLEAHSLDIALDLDPAERPARIVIVAVDAGSLDFITSVTASGRLPNFGRILDAGAVMHLATIHPTSAEAVWAAVATGKLPQKNGVRSAGSYRFPGGGDPILLLPDYCFSHLLVRFGFLIEQPHTPATLRARTLWNILGALGIPVGVVGWPLTYPAQPVRGYLVSDLHHRLIATPAGVDDTSAVYPPEIHEVALRAAEDVDAEADPVMQAPSLDRRYDAPGRTDRAYDRIARALGATRPTQIGIVRYQSLDPIGHYFLRYVMPSEFGDVTDEEQRRFGSVLEQHYALIDDAIGRAIRSLAPDDLLLVVSGYGMEPIGIVKRLLERAVGDPDLSGTHEAAPDGFLMAYGGPVVRGRLTSRASVVDVVPTVLYFLGLPIGHDMDGFARTDLFKSSFTEERPITFIPTYDR
jgi:predicted AlkP superfamily phosphohydrolase/phosphomutase